MATEDTKRLENRFLAVTLILFGILSFLVLRGFFYYAVGGVLLVFMFFPLHRKLRRLLKNNVTASLLSFLIVGITVVGPLVLVGFLIWNDASEFARDYDPDKLNETIQQFLTPFGIEGSSSDSGNGTDNATVEAQRTPSDVANFLGKAMKRLAERIGTEVVAILPGLALGLVIAGFVTYYGFSEGEAFYVKFRHALPLPDEIEEPLFSEIRKVTKVVFVGNILISIFGGIIGAATFLIFGVPNAIFWGFIMIILGILPVLGAPMVWVPAGLLKLAAGDTFSGIAILAINGILVIGYVDNILRPKMIGKAANVHPVVVLIGVLGGLEAFGPLGFVVGPLVLAVFIAIVRSYTEWHPRWKERRRLGIESYHPAAHIEIIEGTLPKEGEAAAPEKKSE